MRCIGVDEGKNHLRSTFEVISLFFDPFPSVCKTAF